MQAPNSPTTTATSSSSSIDSLTCQWGDCRHRCSSAETLYEHVCEKHVGRKSTNNLSLTCQWGSCRTTTVKRDHITSHIRVHVPLKPHKCDFCGKAFKRPQDLKKHVKTHADESVLLRSPEPTSSNRAPVANGYQQNGTSKHSGYMADNNYTQNGGYGHYNSGHSHNFYSSTGAAHNPNFGPVYYQVPQTAGLASGDDNRKRGHDALNSFFGDVKRRHIDPNQYYDLGSRLGSVQSLSLPMFANMPGMVDDHGGAAVGYNTASLPLPTYSTPFSELRTKNDLMSIDQFLQQLQETTYEYTGHNSTIVPQTQPIPQMQQPMPHGDLSNLQDHMPIDAHTPGSLSTSSHADSITPALTPSSYTATYSPSSVHSNHVSVSPVSRPVNANLYPSLPSLNDVTGSTAPPSLANPYEDFGGELRFHGGTLQRAQTRTTPTLSPTLRHDSINAERDTQLAKGVGKMELSTPKPAEVGEFTTRQRQNEPRRSRGGSANSDTASTGSGSSADDQHDRWVQNMRVIQRLRDFITERLRDVEKRGEVMPTSPTSTPAKTDRDGDSEMGEARKESQSLYPVLRRA